jgi:hypothetical protein
MVQVIGYGEDSLTLWALGSQLPEILGKLGDQSDPSRCKILYRPSFGRAGGENSPQFGEFDFMILADRKLYLGESKWSRSWPKLEKKLLDLDPKQKARHELFAFYVKRWTAGAYSDWDQFVEAKSPVVIQRMEKPLIKNRSSMLYKNLRAILDLIVKHYEPYREQESQFALEIKNVLLVLHRAGGEVPLENETQDGFSIVPVAYVPEDWGIEGQNSGHFVQLPVEVKC